MEKERMTIYDMILQIINSNQLSADEEAEVLGILRKREEERESARMSMCLAGVIEAEMQKKVEDGIIKQSTKDRYHPVYRRCFLETKTGNMAASELSDSIIQEFIMEAHEFFGLNRNDMHLFMGMLQMGLNKMSDTGLLTFSPNKKLYRGYIESDRGIRYIDNPYSDEETNKIMSWVENNFFDSRGLAVALWLSSNISPEEIVSLGKEDCWDSDSGVGKGLFRDNIKMRYVSTALKLHPENEEYIFMVKKDGGWKKLNERSLQIKLYYICQDIGITYRAFHKNETILPSK